MKLAFSTLPCAAWTLEHTLEVCTRYQVDAIEMRLGLNEWSDPGMGPARLQQLRSQAGARGVAVCSLGTGIVVRDDDPAATVQLRQCVQVARALHARGLRIMLGTYKVRYSEAAPAPDMDGIVRWLRRACRIAAEDGVEVWIETHNEFASGRALRPVLDAVGMDNLKIVFDVIHPLEVGESLDETLRLVGADIAHVHIKDGAPWDDPDLANWRYTRLGEGRIDLAGTVGALAERGYAGYYSLEWESAWREEIRGPQFEGAAMIGEFAQLMRDIRSRLERNA